MSRLVITEKENLVSIADAIRTKGGYSENLTFPEGFVSAIEGIENGSAAPETCELWVSVVSVNASSGDYHLLYAVNTYDESTGETGISVGHIDASAGSANSGGYNNVVVGGMIALFWQEALGYDVLDRIDINCSNNCVTVPIIGANGRGAAKVYEVRGSGTIRIIRNA